MLSVSKLLTGKQASTRRLTWSVTNVMRHSPVTCSTVQSGFSQPAHDMRVAGYGIGGSAVEC